MHYTIVGGGIAALSAVKAIRAYDPHGEILVAGEEKHSFYYRPMTPLVVTGDRERDELLHADPLPANLRFMHARAVSLDAAGRRVLLADGGALPFERLLIATGSSPRVPEIPGITCGHVHCLRTLADAERLRAAAAAARQAVVVGGGFVGVKVALALRHRGVAVTLVEQLPHILAPRLDAEAAGMVAERLEAAGVSIRTGETVREILPDSVTLASSARLAADLVCIAIGVAPNIGWLAGSGLAMGVALRVDERMQTSLPGVFAAGDVVEMTDTATGQIQASALWTNAVEMGKTAGINMAGGKAKYPGGLAVMNATEIEGLALVAAGDVLGEATGATVVRERRNGNFRKLVFRGDRLAGVILAGDLSGAGICTALVRAATPLSPAMRERLASGRISYADCCVRKRRQAA